MVISGEWCGVGKIGQIVIEIKEYVYHDKKNLLGAGQMRKKQTKEIYLPKKVE